MLKSLRDKLENDFVSRVLNVLYYALPNLEYFNIKSEAVHGVPISWSYLLISMGYGVSYAAFVMVAACISFSGVISSEGCWIKTFGEGHSLITSFLFGLVDLDTGISQSSEEPYV